jgi:hypothetical protein
MKRCQRGRRIFTSTLYLVDIIFIFTGISLTSSQIIAASHSFYVEFILFFIFLGSTRLLLEVR